MGYYRSDFGVLEVLYCEGVEILWKATFATKEIALQFAHQLPPPHLKSLGGALIFKWQWKWSVLLWTSHQQDASACCWWYHIWLDVRHCGHQRQSRESTFKTTHFNLINLWAWQSSSSAQWSPCYTSDCTQAWIFLINQSIPLKRTKTYTCDRQLGQVQSSIFNTFVACDDFWFDCHFKWFLTKLRSHEGSLRWSRPICLWEVKWLWAAGHKLSSKVGPAVDEYSRTGWLLSRRISFRLQSQSG